MSEKVVNAYQPPQHFKEVEKLHPVVQEAVDDNTELWLIRIPSNEVGQADLREKRLKLNVDASDGVVGHFFNGQGQEYNIVKHSEVEMLQPYAIIPNGLDPFVVRKITCQVGFVKAPNVEAKQSNQQLDRDVGVTQHEQETSGLTADKQQSDPVDVAKPSKKKRRRSEVIEKS